MTPRARLGVLLIYVTLAAALFSASSCGDTATSTSVVGPSAERCGVTVKSSTPALPASGGTGNLTVDTARECAWSARADAPWVTLSGAQGQGPATLAYSVAPNPIGRQRRAAVVVSDQHVDIVQEAAPCAFDVAERRKDVASIGGDITVSLSGTEGCTWAAMSNADWVGQAAPATGNGSAVIRFTVTANPGEGRSGTVTVAGITVTIVQAPFTSPGPAPVPTPDPGPPSPGPPGPACTVLVSPSARAIAASGGDSIFSVSAPAGCAWTANSSESWIAVAEGARGEGNGSVRLVIAANTGAVRNAVVSIGGSLVTITQVGAPACSYTITPVSQTVTSGATATTVDVRAQSSCTWTSVSGAPWITIVNGDTGTGNGRVGLQIAANPGPARTGTVRIAGETFTLQQEGTSCTYSIKPTWYDAGRGPDDIRVRVTAPGGCNWVATTDATWVNITEGRSGSGDGTVRLIIPANDGAPRTTIVTIAGLPFTLTQFGPLCTNTIDPSSRNVTSAKTEVSVTVNAGAGCTWTATSDVPWIMVAPQDGAGSGSVRLTVDANSGPARTGTVRIAGQTFTVQQEGSSCVDRIKPTYYDAGRGPDNIAINVTAPASCTWTVTNVPTWVSVAEGATGTGNGLVRLLVDPNFGAARSATIMIGGQPFSLTQHQR